MYFYLLIKAYIIKSCKLNSRNRLKISSKQVNLIYSRPPDKKLKISCDFLLQDVFIICRETKRAAACKLRNVKEKHFSLLFIVKAAIGLPDGRSASISATD